MKLISVAPGRLMGDRFLQQLRAEAALQGRKRCATRPDTPIDPLDAQADELLPVWWTARQAYSGNPSLAFEVDGAAVTRCRDASIRSSSLARTPAGDGLPGAAMMLTQPRRWMPG
ncbi:hypothetical protein ACNI3R_03730 [Rhizorhabdus sp. FW153]